MNNDVLFLLDLWSDIITPIIFIYLQFLMSFSFFSHLALFFYLFGLAGFFGSGNPDYKIRILPKAVRKYISLSTCFSHNSELLHNTESNSTWIQHE